MYSYVFCRSGARETDYPAGEEVSLNAEAGPVGEGSSSAASSSPTDCDSVLGGITVVGCTAEGAAAIPQTADSPGNTDGEAGNGSKIHQKALSAAAHV